MTKNHTTQETAETLHARLAAVDITAVPIMSRDRSIPRTAQAALVRQLFRQLNLKGISVTAPTYSMACSVDVKLPKRSDYTFDSFAMVVEGDPARKANHDAAQRVGSILLAAFPSHDDRSELQSDYFNYKWSVA